jgi:uncharacterized protein
MEKLVYKLDEIPPEGLEFELAPDPALYGIDAVKVLLPPGVSGWIRILKERRELAVSGEVRAVLESPCSRCLAPSACSVAGEFSFRMIPEGKGPDAEETELTSGELEVEFYVGDEVDVRRIIAEQVYLNVPLSILCRPECRGLCPQCGQDLNAADCGHRAQSMDPRWNALQELKKNLDH